MGVTIKKQVNNNTTTAIERTAALATGGLNAFYWYQIFALDSAVVEVKEMFSSHGSLLTIAMYHHGETLNFLSLINLKFRVRAPNECCILKFMPNQSFVCNFLSTRMCKRRDF